MNESGPVLKIMAVDCCEHMLAALQRIPGSIKIADKTVVAEGNGINIIVVGFAQYPIRRLYLSELRRIYPTIPVLVLRRENYPNKLEEYIRGEFLMSDVNDDSDYDVVRSLRTIMPLPACPHLHKGYTYNTVREVIKILASNYTDPQLDLDKVARELPMSPKRLSRILNQQVGVSFRQLLRDMRIEEAKRILTSRQFSVKEVATRVGFSDSHYFSRSFKELTGVKAGEYQSHTATL